MSNRKRISRRPATREDRGAFLSMVAARSGQTVEEVEETMAEAVRLGWLTETPDGWQAALPADVAPPDWDGPVT